MNRNHANTSQQAAAANQRASGVAPRAPVQFLSVDSTAQAGGVGVGVGVGGAGSLTMINAPTSLTNLAQLSGISLLPIAANDYPSQALLSHPTSANKRTTANNCNLLQNTDTIHQSTSSHRISSLQNNRRQPKLAKPTNDERLFNISSIPSVQSLNQTSNDLIFRRNINVVDHSRSQFNNHTQSMSSANVANSVRLTSRTQAPHITQANNLSQTTNGIQVIPVANSLSSLPYLSRSRQPATTNLDTMNALSDSIVQENNYVDVNGDANNISLIKLMAILNNPALTITAVGPKEPSNCLIDDLDASHQQDDNIFETFGRQLPNSSSRLKQNNHMPTRAPASTSRSNQTKLRLPQSAANLQMIHGSQLQQSSGMAQLISVGQSSLDSQAMQRFEHRHNDFKLDWLSDYNQDSRIGAAAANTTNMQVQYQNDPCEIDYNTSDSADPTILSTSVRNLLMQQISQNTNKQQNKSAQLLRHIANQEQDNDDSSSRDRNQLPIVESAVYIPGNYRIVKQLSDDVKIIETESTVSTSGLMKLKSKGPTKTSRYRLYVPGMDNGNLRHSRTNESRYYLNDIQITNNQAREVHLSDRHLMLDSMMNLENKRERKNEPIEPDEIFINRSKRVMSKVDTMLERKKRRRFERISGREPPKNNSIEEQCAESEEEWYSDDEAMDLESAGIIKTQLPLEEVETQAKKDHFMSVGLVSRETKHNIEAEICERKLNLITPLAFEKLEQPADDIHRFIDTVVKTYGEDVQLRVDSNIKRSDLPLIEGLNRNTSRLKMTYMNLLGLEKRSKRTTLYKVKQFETISANSGKQQTDLSRTSRELTSDELRPRLDTQRQLLAMSIGHQVRSVPQQPALRMAPSNCRDILKFPNKNDYMKSLGLMAS